MNNDDIKAVGRRIKKALSARNMTQRELADTIGTTEASISRYVTGNREPKGLIIYKMAKTLGTSCDYLLGFTDKL